MRIGDWKLVAAANEPWELYDLTSDRAEQQSLIDKNPEKARELEQAWNDLTTEFAKLIHNH